jgi:hypothetical protein
MEGGGRVCGVSRARYIGDVIFVSKRGDEQSEAVVLALCLAATAIGVVAWCAGVMWFTGMGGR